MHKILFVCLGNICRSPTAEGVFRHLVQQAQRTDEFIIDSAGTGAYHAGEAPDPRMQQAAKRAGYELAGQARQVQVQDFANFDHIFAMDQSNLKNLLADCPPQFKDKIRLFCNLLPQTQGQDVPDPYYGGPEGFDKVVRLVEDCGRALLASLPTS